MAEFPKLVRKRADGPAFPLFERVTVGPWTVSVQASRFNYSTPREDIESADAFSAFEVAIWPTGAARDWCQPREYPKLAEFVPFFEEGRTPVAGYVPRVVVAHLVAALANVDPVADRVVASAGEASS